MDKRYVLGKHLRDEDRFDDTERALWGVAEVVYADVAEAAEARGREAGKAEGRKAGVRECIEAVKAGKHNPDRYHYLCYGGSTVLLTDGWGKEETGVCPNDTGNEGRGWYGSKGCIGCDRRIKGILELDDWKRGENRGMDRAADILRRLLHEGEGGKG